MPPSLANIKGSQTWPSLAGDKLMLRGVTRSVSRNGSVAPDTCAIGTNVKAFGQVEKPHTCLRSLKPDTILKVSWAGGWFRSWSNFHIDFPILPLYIELMIACCQTWVQRTVSERFRCHFWGRSATGSCWVGGLRWPLLAQSWRKK